MNDLDAFIRNLTTLPGVYSMLDAQGKIIYVGKAKNLKKRVTSYFQRQLDNKTLSLVRQIHSIQVTVTRNEREALLLESSLIKQLSPRYNVIFKDDKSFPYLYLSTQEEYPRLSFHRGSRAAPGKYYGPYPSAGEAREALNLLQSIFKIRQCDNYFFKSRSRPCLQYQIKRCTAPCVGYIDPIHYRQDVQNAMGFLEGKSDAVLTELIDRMGEASEALDYERAGRIRDQIALLRRIQSQQIIVGERINVDVLGIAMERGLACVHLLVIREGRMLGSRHYFPKTVSNHKEHEYSENDSIDKPITEDLAHLEMDSEPDEEVTPEQALLSGFMMQHYLRDVQTNVSPSREETRDIQEVEGETASSEDTVTTKPAAFREDYPNEIVIPIHFRDQKLFEELLTELAERKIEIKKPSRGRPFKWLEMANRSAMGALKSRLNLPTNLIHRFEDLQEALGLPAIPERIECFDVSHTMGESTVASCVVFDVNGPVKEAYRRFNIKGVIPGDDYGAMRQALTRHYTRLKAEGKTLPDILLIDGGKGQLTQAITVLHELQVTGVLLLGVAKGPERKPGLETIFRPNGDILPLVKDSKAMHLIQQIRDEAHRFAITLHRKQSRKTRVHSRLEDIPGVGKSRRLAILRRFGGLQEVKQASVEELSMIPGISETLALRIYQALHGIE